MEHDAIYVHAGDLDAAYAGACAERETHRADHLLVVESVAGEGRRRVGTNPELCERVPCYPLASSVSRERRSGQRTPDGTIRKH
jgi:hypothetical protein